MTAPGQGHATVLDLAAAAALERCLTEAADAHATMARAELAGQVIAPAPGWSSAMLLGFLLDQGEAVLPFVCPGRPAPKGSLTYMPPRGRGGRGRYVEDNPASPKWRLQVNNAARRAKRHLPPERRRLLPINGPALVVARYAFTPPASARKTGPLWPTAKYTTGDLDKLDRNLLDALVDAGVLVDDARVVRLVAVSEYVRGGWQGLHAVIHRLGEGS